MEDREIRAAVKQMKSGKAGRSNDVPCLILEEFLIRLFNTSVESERMAEEGYWYSVSRTRVMCSNIRGIKLMSHLHAKKEHYRCKWDVL